MRRICTILLLTIWAFVAMASEKSATVVYINGSKYYIHTVQPGETLFALSKLYQVGEKAILEQNPEAAAGLKAQTNIKIPFVASLTEQVSEKKLRKEFDSHLVAQGETLYAISRRYAIPIQTIIEDNPNLDPIHLRLGERILVRKQQKWTANEQTTAMRMLCGLSYPSSGCGTVAGYDVMRQGELIKRRIGYMSQRFSLYDDLTVLENMRLYGGIYGLSRREVLRRAVGVLNRLDFRSEAATLVGALPLGWKQKLAFSVATLHRPEVVFLDEPTGGVDPVTRRQFWEMIYQAAAGGTTVFVTTHYMDEAEYCSRISVMVDGQIRALGTPSDLKKQFAASSMDEVFRSLAREAKRSE